MCKPMWLMYCFGMSIPIATPVVTITYIVGVWYDCNCVCICTTTQFVGGEAKLDISLISDGTQLKSRTMSCI